MAYDPNDPNRWNPYAGVDQQQMASDRAAYDEAGAQFSRWQNSGGGPRYGSTYDPYAQSPYGGSNPTQRQPGASQDQRRAAYQQYVQGGMGNSTPQRSSYTGQGSAWNVGAGNTGARGGGVSSLSGAATAARASAAQFVALAQSNPQMAQQMADAGMAPTINGVYGGGWINDRSGAPAGSGGGVPMAQDSPQLRAEWQSLPRNKRPSYNAWLAQHAGQQGGGQVSQTGNVPLPQQSGGTRLVSPTQIGQQQPTFQGNPFAGAPNPKAAMLRPSVGPTQGMGGAGGSGGGYGGGGSITGGMAAGGYTTPSVANANPYDESSMIAAQEADRNAALQTLFDARANIGNSQLAQGIEGLGARVANQGDTFDERTQRDMEARIIDENRTAQADAARAMYEDLGGTGRLGAGAGIGALRDTRRRYDQDRANQLRDLRMGVADRNASGRRENLGAATGALGSLSQILLGTNNKIADIFANTDRDERDYAKMMYQQAFGMGGGYGA